MRLVIPFPVRLPTGRRSPVGRSPLAVTLTAATSLVLATTFAPAAGAVTVAPRATSAPAAGAVTVAPQASSAPAASAVTVAPRASSAPAAGAVTVHDPIGVIDEVTSVHGRLKVNGWAIDRDTRSPIRVQIRVDGRAVRGATANVSRPDLSARYGGKYGITHGFTEFLTLPNGVHTICLVAVNTGPGKSRVIGCRPSRVNNNPVGTVDVMYQLPQGVLVSGWSVDPNTRAPITVRILVDNQLAVAAPAAVLRTPTGSWAWYGGHHGFKVNVAVADGTHQVCVTGVNLGPGTSGATQLSCQNITIDHSPVGGQDAPTHPVGSVNTAVVTGYAVDRDSLDAISVTATVDGAPQPTPAIANLPSPAALQALPRFSRGHGFALTMTGVDGGQHSICLTLHNVGAGIDRPLACQLLLTTGETQPSQPIAATGWPGSKRADVTWSPSLAPAASPVLRYTIVGLPNGQSLTVTPNTARVTIPGLTNGATYRFVVRAYNALGAGSAAIVTVVPSNVPPQFTEAPVSTSHYPRNWTGNLAVDVAHAKAQGIADAAANPSSHKYVILQDIGGQDELNGGVLLSATSIFRSYAHTVALMNAYTDGYASHQNPYAPMLLAIGTNNDVDVSYAAGASWARNVVDPVRAYVAAHHPGIEVAGANDLEPGFSATVGASRAWLSGYLAATTARFVFNGSADGCSVSAAGSGCNNGWAMTDLQWLSGGAAPSRIVSLPQIYNYAMPFQWRNISLTGTVGGLPRLYFGGPLTEYNACGGGTRCFSITGNDAWNKLWSALSSSPATQQYELPYSTDLQVN